MVTRKYRHQLLKYMATPSEHRCSGAVTHSMETQRCDLSELWVITQRYGSFVKCYTNTFLFLFCRLRLKFTHDDLSTNPGYALSPVISQRNEAEQSSSVKVSIEISESQQPVTFTCDVSSPVELLIMQALCWVHDDLSQVDIGSYILKVCGREEVLQNKHSLGSHEYMQNCRKWETEIKLQLLAQSTMRRDLARTAEDDTAPVDLEKYLGHIEKPLKENVTRDILAEYLEGYNNQVNLLLQNESTQYKTVDSVIHAVKNLCCSLDEVETPAITEAVKRLKHAVNLAKSCSPKLREHDVDVKYIFIHNSTDLFKSDFPFSYSSYEKYYLTCALTHNGRNLFKPVQSKKVGTYKSFFYHVKWDELINFPISVALLPLETMLNLSLYGVLNQNANNSPDSNKQRKGPELLGKVSMPLFDFKRVLSNGTKLLSLCMPQQSSPAGAGGKRKNLTERIVLQVDFPSPAVVLYVGPQQTKCPDTKSLETPDPDIWRRIEKLCARASAFGLTRADRQLLWDHRHHCGAHQHSLPKILASAPSWDWGSLGEIHGLLHHWPSLSPVSALELLDSKYVLHSQSETLTRVELFIHSLAVQCKSLIVVVLQASENFIYSCAGCCVATYLLGICDRHNDNIMLRSTGHMFHIDFGKFLGHAQMIGSFKRDRAPFVLTSDMAYVINGGERPTSRFQLFIDLCSQAYNLIRKHSSLFLNLLSLMMQSGLPELTGTQDLKYVYDALQPQTTDAEATIFFTRLIESSLGSVATKFNFFIHNLAQLRFSGLPANDEPILSFSPRTYTLKQDGRIRDASIYSFQKRYNPDKHYTYVVRVLRDGQNEPQFVFRTFDEFQELHNKLSILFPLWKLPGFPNKMVLGRTHIKDVASKRKVELNSYVHSLMRSSAEVAQVRLSDHSAADLILCIKYPEIVFTPDTTYFLSVNSSVSDDGTDPNPYVKTYLLPDPHKTSKRKTKISRKTRNPTFNEMLVYSGYSKETLRQRELQLGVLSAESLRENFYLGGITLSLQDFDLSQETVKWYKLTAVPYF
uniref:Phosphatidylinositol-4-phosphate 3-kinase, catalytic subunit type 2 alpha n=1 Tax=Astyanax mexicanus TaxID=7994 RepID=A0A8B9HXW2_ASTMX